MSSIPLIDRRAVLACLGLTLAAARSRSTLLERAVSRAGGALALAKVRALHWEGSASIFARTGQIDIGVSTRVVPFVSARSDTWLLSEGPGKLRSLIIEPTGGQIDRLGKVSEMPNAMFVHERAQYALYGLMLLVTLEGPGSSARPGDQPDTIIVRHPKAPETTLGFDAGAKLIWAANVVPDPEDGRSIAQRFTFSGEVASHDVRWPARIEISQNDRPYFDLRLSKFGVEI